MENIDLGVWSCPTSWNDITLEQLLKLQRQGEQATVSEIVAALTDHTVEEVEALPISFTEKILSEMSFLKEPLPEVQPTNRVIIDGETYTVHNEREMRTGEFVASQMALKDDTGGFPTLLAIIARKDGEEYTSEFENKVLPERIEIFRHAKALDVLPVTTFFLELWLVSEGHSQLYGEVKQAIEDLTQQLTESSKKGGLGKALSTRLLKRRLKRLKRQIDGL